MYLWNLFTLCYVCLITKVWSLTLPACSPSVLANRLRMEQVFNAGGTTMTVDEFFVYTLGDIYLGLNQNTIVKLNKDLTYAWAKQCGSPHSFAGMGVRRIGANTFHAYYLASDSLHVLDRSTGAVLASTGK